MQVVEVRLKGHLDESWADWLEGITITHAQEDETILSGAVVDQAALFGLIAKLRDLGVELASISYRDVEMGASTDENGADREADSLDITPGP